MTTEQTELELIKILTKGVLEKVDWRVFKSKETIQQSLEIQALILNAARKANKTLEMVDARAALQQFNATVQAIQEQQRPETP